MARERERWRGRVKDDEGESVMARESRVARGRDRFGRVSGDCGARGKCASEVQGVARRGEVWESGEGEMWEEVSGDGEGERSV